MSVKVLYRIKKQEEMSIFLRAAFNVTKVNSKLTLPNIKSNLSVKLFERAE